MEAGAVDQETNGEFATVRLEHGHSISLHRAEQPGLQVRLDPLKGDQLRKLFAHHPIVHNSGRGYTDRFDAADVGFGFAHFLEGQSLQLEFVRDPALVQSLEQRFLLRARGDNQLATDLVRNRMFPAEGDHGVVTHPGEACFEAARAIVNAGVNDATVPTGLVSGPTLLLLEHGEAGGLFPPDQCISHSQPNNATPDDRVIISPHRPPRTVTSRACALCCAPGKPEFENDVQLRRFLVHSTARICHPIHLWNFTRP